MNEVFVIEPIALEPALSPTLPIELVPTGSGLSNIILDIPVEALKDIFAVPEVQETLVSWKDTKPATLT